MLLVKHLSVEIISHPCPKSLPIHLVCFTKKSEGREGGRLQFIQYKYKQTKISNTISKLHVILMKKQTNIQNQAKTSRKMP